MCGLNRLPLADAVTIAYTSPVWVSLSCRLFMKEPLTRTDLVMTLCCLCGVILITRPPFMGFPATAHSSDNGNDGNDSHAGEYATGLTCAILGAVIVGPISIQIRQLKSVEPLFLVFYLAAVSSSIALPLSIATEDWTFTQHSLVDYITILAAGSIAFFGQLTYTMALQLGNAGGPLMRLNYFQIVLGSPAPLLALFFCVCYPLH